VVLVPAKTRGPRVRKVKAITVKDVFGENAIPEAVDKWVNGVDLPQEVDDDQND
jgi:hypothetical protein